MSHVPHRRRSVARLVLAAAVIAGVAALAPAAHAQATNECEFLTNCTSVAGGWTAVLASPGTTPVPGTTAVRCPRENQVQVPVGSDYQLSGGGSPLPSVNRFLFGPGAGLLSSSAFFAVNLGSVDASYRPLIGCVAQASLGSPVRATSTQASERLLRTREIRLRPSRRVRHSHRCPSGERLVSGAHGVRFDTRRPPSARELGDLEVDHRVAGGRVRVRVRTGASVGDDERVTLEILAFCRR